MNNHQKAINQYYSDLANSHTLKFITRENIEFDNNLLNKDECTEYLKLQSIPILQTENSITIGTANPSTENQAHIREFFAQSTKKNIELVVISRQDISFTLARTFEQKYTHDIKYKRYELDPVHSASYTFSLIEKIVVISIILLLVFALILFPSLTKSIIFIALSFGTSLVMAYKMGLSLQSWLFLKIEPVPKEVVDIKDPKLPYYTVLVPLLHEKYETIVILLESIKKFSYPAEKLDIKLLLEKDDTQTLEVLNRFDLPWYFEICTVPPGTPRSKPRACNYGLYLSFGEYLVIYDAEDQPHHDQIRTALACFNINDSKVVCVQAPLNFYNYKENLLTKLFTFEYTHWFDVFVPALVILKVPVPLGGTSNHFKTKILNEIGAWDPYIGTEDADIGIRIYRKSYITKYIPETTYEEANTQVMNWFKQRTRWNKGYMQTYLVNMRDPINMLKQIGLMRFLHFQLFVGGNVFIQLTNLPLLIGLIIFTFFNDSIFGITVIYKLVFLIMWYNFIISNFILLFCEFISMYKRKYYSLLPFVIFRPFYWMMMSFAGYLAIVELLIRPGYWYKTEHGISKKVKKEDVYKS